MSAPLSVIVPTLDAAGTIGPALASLSEGLTDGLIRELILADGGSGDDISGIAEAIGAKLIQAERGRGSQLATGARAASGTWYLFLHADSQLPPGWSRTVRTHMHQQPGRAGYFGLGFDSRHPMARVTESWANLRSTLCALPYGDQGLLVSARIYGQAGGYPEIPLMEDVALIRALGRKRLARLPGRILTSAERYERDGWVRRGARNLSTLGLFLCGASPERLARRYTRK